MLFALLQKPNKNIKNLVIFIVIITILMTSKDNGPKWDLYM